jgi:2-succinyl-5-enolpyruvyl-6-hydroxy-3-cyclohexene-1-carboxylate synthase
MANPAPLVMSNKKGVQTLVMAAQHYGVEHVVICPGSRNAPFTISFNRCGLFKCHSIADERVAAFYALGMALATSKPVIVVCTSGSAGINLGPAIAEAYYLKAPLIAITADRPKAWVDQGNGQTIRQEGLFENYICGSYSLDENPENADLAWMNHREISKLFNRVMQGHGPIHFNVPLSEPLYDTAALDMASSLAFYRRAGLSAKLEARESEEFAAQFQQARKVMLLVGQMHDDHAVSKVVTQLAALPNVVVLTETTSNIGSPSVISTIDRLIMSIHSAEALKGLMPDLLITLGGMVVSKKIKALLRSHKPSRHWHVNEHDEGLDTYTSLSVEVSLAAATFLQALLHTKDIDSDYAETWRKLKTLAEAGHQTYVNSMPWSDFSAVKHILQQLKSPLTLHMANSSPVRYVQLFGAQADLIYHANRGTSGIDGSTSTAAGWAKARPHEEVLLLTGDTAFMYDSNALWNRGLPENFKIIVINNEGGGIFRIIDGPAGTQELETFFEAHHPANIERLASAFDLPHFHANDEAGLIHVLPRFFAVRGAALLEVRTPAKRNAAVLKNYFKHIRTHLEGEGLPESAQAGERS